ncbi:hypothetical protein HDU96_011021 [Phlyctochytrium bullatum]|nr:hypothetical protein HDU96_011021 [Phlyctochytrium bullatum]
MTTRARKAKWNPSNTRALLRVLLEHKSKNPNVPPTTISLPWKSFAKTINKELGSAFTHIQVYSRTKKLYEAWENCDLEAIAEDQTLLECWELVEKLFGKPKKEVIVEENKEDGGRSDSGSFVIYIGGEDSDSTPPDGPSDSTLPDVPGDNTPPDVPGDNTPPDVPGDSTPPDVPGDNTPPDVPGDTPNAISEPIQPSRKRPSSTALLDLRREISFFRVKLTSLAQEQKLAQQMMEVQAATVELLSTKLEVLADLINSHRPESFGD